MQAQYERHAAQAAVAQTAKVQLRKETEWMRRQPKARSTKSKSRQDAFYELSDVARSGPKKDVKADFGAGAMSRQVEKKRKKTAYCPGLP
jgi:ATP-binding cassette subfamily F protein uup